ncbi:uncharacterized protein LOC130719637 [Lotus japonicus]|uniref:uncharacterized protein LOC130719637 n=1 Tax=Lotus japonicus TaxID=34305 RepID=UPI0025889E2C|nr:uncharacterized protein LOC130719637 [Lotus japonicus]
MSLEFGKKSDAGLKPVKNVHGVRFLGLNPSSSTPSRVTHSSAAIASQESSGSTKKTRSQRIKHVVRKKGGSSAQDISDESDNDVPFDKSDDVPTAGVNQESTDALENLAKVATGPDVEQNVEPQEAYSSPSGSEEKSHASSDEKEDENFESVSDETPSIEEIPVTDCSMKKTGVFASKKVADGKKKKKDGSSVKTPKISKISQVQASEKKKKPEKKKEKRKLVVERELHEDALEPKEIMNLLIDAGLMRTVKDIGRFFVQLAREFIVNIPTDCDDEDNAEYMKVYVRGKCVNFSPQVVNDFLGRNPVAMAEEEPDFDKVANTLTGKMVRKWPKKGLLPSRKLIAKYAVLFKIGSANRMTTNHLSGVTAPLAKMLYLIGTGGEFDFGQLVFDQTLKHAGSFAVKLPILFPCLLSEIIAHQHPNVVRADELQDKKPLPLKFDYRLFARTHVPDIVLTAAKGIVSASGTQVCKIRKLNVDKLIKAMTDVPAAAEEEEAEKGTEDVAAYWLYDFSSPVWSGIEFYALWSTTMDVME